MPLSPNQLDAYARDGFVLISGLIPDASAAAAADARAAEALDGAAGGLRAAAAGVVPARPREVAGVLGAA